jgi:hypothetical protein
MFNEGLMKRYRAFTSITTAVLIATAAISIIIAASENVFASYDASQAATTSSLYHLFAAKLQ